MEWLVEGRSRWGLGRGGGTLGEGVGRGRSEGECSVAGGGEMMGGGAVGGRSSPRGLVGGRVACSY